MEFNYNHNKYKFPATLAAITLQQRIELHDVYGEAFETQYKELNEIEDQAQKSIEQASLRIHFACQCFSFFTGIHLDEILSTFDIEQVMNVYNTSIAMVLNEEAQIELKNEYEFNDDLWTIAPFELKATSGMTFNEFLTSKEIVRQLDQVGKGKLHSLPYLCAIYFRKINEPFQESFIAEDSERMKLMKKLPMDIALAVGFFLTSSMNLYQKTLQYSNQELGKEQI